ncbi:reverse transcriptase [Gossypium australe]|uniref:Reverse transcriptase n=1 Tax=Gossypium australe TaxID=47621 RepID=A0A5B6VIA1_9ROSI|nr:reverse transcriptase [Gossypium australe]
MCPLKASDNDGLRGFLPKVLAYCGVSWYLRIQSNTYCSDPKVLHYCIDRAQSAFVSGRLISYNTLVSYEVLCSIKKKMSRKDGSFALKLDMSKMYDRVEWPFIKIMLRRMRFSDMWVQKIMMCVETVSYFVVMNWEIGQMFFPSHGFSEGFSALLRMTFTSGDLKGVHINRHAPLITHLLFAGDSLIFGEAAIEGVRALKNRLEIYVYSLGQLINFDKSSKFFSSNASEENREKVCQILGVPWTPFNCEAKKKKKKAFKEIKEKLVKRVSSWSSKMLYFGGREVLIKAVLQAIPIYVMSCFLLPNSFCKELEVKKAGRNGLHWCSWISLCIPKENSGMGFRDLSKFNIALLAKQE